MPLIAAYPNVIGNVENDTLFRPTHTLALPETPCPTPNQQGNFLQSVNIVLSSTLCIYRCLRCLLQRSATGFSASRAGTIPTSWSLNASKCTGAPIASLKMSCRRPTSDGILRRLFYNGCSGNVVTLKQSVHMSTKCYHSPNARHNTSTTLPSHYYHQQYRNDQQPEQTNGS